MEYCGPRGIPHSEFLRWNEEDQDKAIAWLLDQGDKCQTCGSYADEWLGEDGRPVDPPPMFARSHTCVGCITLEQQEEEVKLQRGGKIPTGMKIYLSRQPPPVKDDEEEDEQ